MSFNILEAKQEVYMIISGMVFEDNVYESPNSCFTYCSEFNGNEDECTGKRNRCHWEEDPNDTSDDGYLCKDFCEIYSKESTCTPEEGCTWNTDTELCE